jgi:hypothetical protein
MNLNRYARPVGVWSADVRYAATGENERLAELAAHVAVVVEVLAAERVLIPDAKPVAAETIDIGGATVIEQGAGAESSLEGLVKISGQYYAAVIEIWTYSDAWLPYTVRGRRQDEIYERNATRLERCFARLAERGLDFEATDTKLALGAGRTIRNVTFDDGEVFVPNYSAVSVDDGEASTLLLDHDRVVLGRRLRDGAGDQVREGYLDADPATRVLVTLTGRHSSPQNHDYTVNGVGRWLGVVEPPAAGIPYDDALLEQLPAGRPAVERMPLPEPAVIALGRDVATVIADAHAANIILMGVSPELIYVDEQLRFTGLVPRSRPFVASAPQRQRGLRSYTLPFDGFETLALGKPPVAKSDIFALAATLFMLATGKHPFGDELAEIMHRVLASAPDAYPGSPKLAAILARALDPDPDARPSARELVALFS